MLTVTQMLRKKGVVGKFVEFFGLGLSNMTLADRATIGNMAPGIRRDLRLLPGRLRDDPLPHHVGPRREPHRAGRGLFEGAGHVARQRFGADPVFTDQLDLDLGDVVPSMAGPKRPEGRVALEGIAEGFAKAMETEYKKTGERPIPLRGAPARITISAMATWSIAAITSCTNTSNPSVLMAAGLLARNANRQAA